MTINELKQYQSLIGEIKDIDSEIVELKNGKTMDVVKASYSEFPYTEHSVKVYGNDEHILNLITKKQREKAELQRLKDNIEKFINNISDSQVRRILKYKYINGYSWGLVASKMKMSGESSVRMIIKRFFEKN